jgi:hypothetical protein
MFSLIFHEAYTTKCFSTLLYFITKEEIKQLEMTHHKVKAVKEIHESKGMLEMKVHKFKERK